MTDRRHTNRLSFDYSSDTRARTVERSVRPELGEVDDDRSATSLARDGRTVEVTVEAADVVALRAATNTWVRLVSVAERLAGLGDEGERGGSRSSTAHSEN